MLSKKLSAILPILLMALLLLAVMIGSLFFGAYALGMEEAMHAIFSNESTAASFLMQNIRIPRILLSGTVGAGLAISGAVIQGLFRNPLADQSLIGITSGAMLFAVLSIVLMGGFLSTLSELLKQSTITVFAFSGGLLTTFLVYMLSKRNGQIHVMTMLLAGIAISAFASAITGVFIYLSDDQQLRDITFWSLGSFGGANWKQVIFAAPIILTCILFLNRYSCVLNAILLGEQEAMHLGFNLKKTKRHIIVLTAIIIGICIALTGIIGFVGLVIPHFLRLLRKTSDYRFLLKSSALVGASFMILADTLSRTIVAPAELPIGILTALVGAPFFLWLLINQKKVGI